MHVLISGAGIAGPSLAWFLAKTGARVTILEKSHALHPHGQNVDIKGGALEVIKKMGLIDQVRRFNTTEEGTRFIAPDGRPFAPFPLKKGNNVSFTSEFEILRGDLAALLYQTTKENANIKYLFGTTINQVDSDHGANVKVLLSNGEVQKLDLLVAADGQWSKVRRQCFPSEDVTVVDKGMYVAYWTVPRLIRDNNWWNIYLGLRSRTITLRPDPHGTIRAMFTCMPCNDTQAKSWVEAFKSDRQAQEEILRKEFADAGWEAKRLLDAMDQAPDFYFHPLQQIRMKKWSRSRIVCLGDTAYAPTALTGMGTSLAIEGAYVLAGEISKLGDGEHPGKALEAFESSFRPYVEETQRLPSFVPAIAHPESAWKRWMIGAVVTTLSRVATISWLVERFDKDPNTGFPLPIYPRFDDK